MNTEAAQAAFAFFMIFGVWIIIALLCIPLYIISSIGFYKLYKNHGYADRAWMAWVPFVNCYIFGVFLYDCVGQNKEYWYKYIYCWYWAVNFIPCIGNIASAVGAIFTLLAILELGAKLRFSVGNWICFFLLGFLDGFIIDKKITELNYINRPNTTNKPNNSGSVNLSK